MPESRRSQAVEGSDFAIVIPTYRRARNAEHACRAALDLRPPAGAIVVVDQSDDEETASRLSSMASQGLRVVRSASRGVSAARNLGARRCARPYVVFLDDDCEAAPDLLAAYSASFGEHPQTDVAFGSLRAARFDGDSGFIVEFDAARQDARCAATSLRSALDGIGANMAVRRSAFEAIGGFDETFGAGTGLQSAEDVDLALRMLARGGAIRRCAGAMAVHHGFRTHAAAPGLVSGYLYGLGAAHVKALRMHGLRALPLTLELFRRWVTSDRSIELHHEPPRLPRLRAFLSGGLAVWRWRIDHRTGRFAVFEPAPAAIPAVPRSQRIPRWSDLQVGGASREQKTSEPG